MLTKFDIGQKVNFYYGKDSTKIGFITRIIIDKEKEISYWIEWDDEKTVTMGILEEHVFY